jgi:hypothetical protein
MGAAPHPGRGQDMRIEPLREKGNRTYMTISELTNADIGRRVAYRPIGQPHVVELGRIRRWNSLYVWVVFDGPRPHWDTAPKRTPMACLPETLEPWNSTLTESNQ